MKLKWAMLWCTAAIALCGCQNVKQPTEVDVKNKPQVIITPGYGIEKINLKMDRQQIDSVAKTVHLNAFFDTSVEKLYMLDNDTIYVMYEIGPAMDYSIPMFIDYGYASLPANYITDKGIKYGSTYNEVTRAYGIPSNSSSDTTLSEANITITYNTLGIKFSLVGSNGGAVQSIIVFSATR